MSSVYRIGGLSKLDRKELEKDPAFSFQEVAITDVQHGELVTIIATLAASGIAALAAFLLRKHRGESFEEHVEEQLADGSIKRRVVIWTRTSTDPPEPEIIRQIKGE